MAIINQRYELHEVLRDEEGIRSARGQDLASGQSIEVHIFLNGQSQDSKMLLRRVVSMPRGGSSALFDFGEEQGTPYVVTRPLGGPFREWVLLGVSGGVQAAPVPPVPAPLLPPPPMHAKGLPQDPFAHLFQPAMTPSPSAGGGYTATQMMPAGPIVPLPPPPLPPPPAAMAAPPPPPPPPPPLAPGMPPLPPPKAQAMGAVTVEFHRLFADDQNVATMRSSSPLLPAAPPQPAVPAPPPVQAQAPAGETPGEFTLMFGVPRKNVSPSGANAGPPAFPAPPPVSPALPAAVIAPAPPPPPPPAVPAAPPVLTAGPGALPPSPVSPAPVVAPALPPPPPAVPAAPPVLTAGPGALPPPPPGRLEALPKGPVAFQLSFHPPVLPVATPAASREPGQRKPPIPAPVSAQFPTGSETVGDLSKILGSAGAAKPNEVKVSAEALTAGEPAAPGEFTAMFRAAIPTAPPNRRPASETPAAAPAERKAGCR